MKRNGDYFLKKLFLEESQNNKANKISFSNHRSLSVYTLYIYY